MPREALGPSGFRRFWHSFFFLRVDFSFFLEKGEEVVERTPLGEVGSAVTGSF
jgi:hypothetical protein